MSSTSDKQSPKDAKPKIIAERFTGRPLLFAGTVATLVLIIVSFVIVPAISKDPGSGGSNLVFGSYAGKSIAYGQGGYMAAQVQEINDQLKSQGNQDTSGQYFAYQVWRRAFENTVIHTAILEEARLSGIIVTGETLDARMAEHPDFIEDGAFSRRKYRETSVSIRSKIRDELRDELVTERFVNDNVAISTSSKEIDFVKAMAGSERTIEYVAFPLSLYPDSEKLAYGKSNETVFRRLKLSRISVTGEKEANDLLARVKQGSVTFEEAAKSYSKDSFADESGNMGYIFSYELNPEFAKPEDVDALLATAKGELSAVFSSSSGSWIFFRMDDPPSVPDWNDLKTLTAVGTYMSRFEKGRMEDYIVARAGEFVASASASNFAAMAAKAKLTVKEAGPFPLNYGKVFDLGYFALFKSIDTTIAPELAQAETNEAFLETCFSLDSGTISDPLVLGENVVVLRVKEVKQADEASLAMIAAYYPRVLQNSLNQELAGSILKSPKLKDKFIEVFFRVFKPDSATSE